MNEGFLDDVLNIQTEGSKSDARRAERIKIIESFASSLAVLSSEPGADPAANIFGSPPPSARQKIAFNYFQIRSTIREDMDNLSLLIAPNDEERKVANCFLKSYRRLREDGREEHAFESVPQLQASH